MDAMTRLADEISRLIDQAMAVSGKTLAAISRELGYKDRAQPRKWEWLVRHGRVSEDAARRYIATLRLYIRANGGEA